MPSLSIEGRCGRLAVKKCDRRALGGEEKAREEINEPGLGDAVRFT